MKSLFFFLSLAIVVIQIDVIRGINIRKSTVKLTHQTRKFREKDKSALETYIDKLKMPTFPLDENYIAKDNEFKPDANITLTHPLDLSTIETGIKWKTVKQAFLVAKTDVEQKDPLIYKEEGIAIMKKFLHLRLADILATIKDVFATNKDYEVKGSPNVFVGTQTNFDTPRVTIKLGLASTTYKVDGVFNFRSLGSTTLTSDIDFTVDFLNYELVEDDKAKADSNGKKPRIVKEKLTIYERINTMAKFIKDFNEIFEKKHAATSLETYDVNLYSSDFGNNAMMKELIELKKTASWSYFVAANRVAQLMLIYNDAVAEYKLVNTEKNDQPYEVDKKNPDPIKKLTTLFESSVPKNEFCGQYLVNPGLSNKKVFAVTNKRSEICTSDSERNTAMVNHANFAGLNNENTARKVCHVLAANFYGLEAYVSFGSIVRIQDLQGGAFDPPPTKTAFEIDKVVRDSYYFKEKPNLRKELIDQNAYIDSILMNFGYAIEHYFQSYHEDPSNSNDYIRKFAKYAGRIYKEKDFLTKKEHKDCWSAAFTAGKFVTDQTTLKSVIAAFRIHIKTEHIDKKFENIKAFIKKGYQCVNSFAFDI